VSSKIDWMRKKKQLPTKKWEFGEKEPLLDELALGGEQDDGDDVRRS